jgi:hypothetical protein
MSNIPNVKTHQGEGYNLITLIQAGTIPFAFNRRLANPFNHGKSLTVLHSHTEPFHEPTHVSPATVT